MPDSQQRTELYQKMALYLTEQCPWIFAYYPTSFRLTHSWIKNYKPHDFCFSQWKYLDKDIKEKENAIRNFKPLTYKDFAPSR
jgi:ABC-type transport system substrate-binding protein